MSWPERHTRTIQIRGREYLWHLSENRTDGAENSITVGNRGGRFFLLVDPYPWHFQIRPADIAQAIAWALDAGWTPATGPTRAVAFSNSAGSFVWLPAGQRFLHRTVEV